MKTVETKVFEVQQTDLKSQSDPDPQHEAEDFLKAQEKVLPDDHSYGARSQQVDLTPPNQSPVEPQENMDDVRRNTLIYCVPLLLFVTVNSLFFFLANCKPLCPYGSHGDISKK